MKTGFSVVGRDDAGIEAVIAVGVKEAGGLVTGWLVGVSDTVGDGEGPGDGSGAGQSLVHVASSLQYVFPGPQKP